MSGNPGHQTLLPYREDHIGVTRWPVGIALGLTVVALALLLTLPTWSQPIGGLTLTAFVFVSSAAAIAWVMVYIGWVLGVEIDQEKIRFGSLRKADSRARRRIPPPLRAKPWATWLYEYRCPIPAIKRIWIVNGGRDALKATGVPLSLRINGQRVSRKGWIGVPFARGGVMFQLDISQASMPTYGWSWKNFEPTTASGWLGESDIWYASVSDPERCGAALVEALRLNGFDVGSEGNVHVIPGVTPRQSVPRPTPITRKGPSHGRLTTGLSMLWALIPLFTLGLFAFVPYAYAALRVRQLHTTLIALLVIGLEAFYWWLAVVVGSQTGPNPQGGGGLRRLDGAAGDRRYLLLFPASP